ncbi:hypothetical protein EOD42_13285 [Rhodovarius crocodyli]|uniref:Uncharacterized protein n=1 Tax=Rhodovarius crocodyli TaxID=1979269 RepID=A0A437MEJ5_9PROT|nr:hypothetical protein [Rhodovarius crocodyli]RVT96091.1 hypothetical protein EOD42_13285 [Rhodovarius crocodyli]
MASPRLASLLLFLMLIAPLFGAAAQTQPGNFYRQSDRPAVMYQYTRDYYCQVQNEAQMAAFGGFSKVRQVPRLAMSGQQTGSCGWPNGFFRRSNETVVYRMSGVGVAPEFGPDICSVANEAQMAAFGGFGRVRVVPPTSDLARGRRMSGVCNPRAG